MQEIEVIRSKRKTISITVKNDLRVIVRAPLRMKESDIWRFVTKKQGWIEKHLALARKRQEEKAPPFTAEELRALLEAAREDLPRRVAEYAPLVGVTVHQITIRKQKSRWGSCSVRGNLNLNCLLMLCPEEVRDYVVVHELCHLREMNHSPAFWREVEKILPDYRTRRDWLKKQGSDIIFRLSG